MAKSFRVVILFLIAFSHILSTKVEGRNLESDDGSDKIKCVDIHKQPAFSDPLLQNHTLQLKPTSTPEDGFNQTRSIDEILQTYENCPEGTIPILQSQLFKAQKTGGFISNGTHLMQLASDNHEYAQASATKGPYFGIQASLNAWHPFIANLGEFSVAQVWVLAGGGPNLNSIEIGWQALDNDHPPRLFTYWTRDNYGGTGCYNLECPGFVQTNRRLVIGGPAAPVSTFNGKQYDLPVIIHKDKVSGNWWARIGKEDLGYWPSAILTNLAQSAESLTWGGEIVNLRPNGQHTTTQMGSGHFSGEGYGKAAFIANIGLINSGGTFSAPDPFKMQQFISNPACYDFMFGRRGTWLGLHFFFGGPGLSPRCP